MHLLYNMCLIFTDGFTSCGKSAALTFTPGQTLCVLLKHNTLIIWPSTSLVILTHKSGLRRHDWPSQMTNESTEKEEPVGWVHVERKQIDIMMTKKLTKKLMNDMQCKHNMP